MKGSYEEENEDNVDVIILECTYCRELMETFWHKQSGGLFSRPNYVLIADWIYHTECWDKMLIDYPIMPIEDYGDDHDPF